MGLIKRFIIGTGFILGGVLYRILPPMIAIKYGLPMSPNLAFYWGPPVFIILGILICITRKS
jgi:hypothetical protein